MNPTYSFADELLDSLFGAGTKVERLRAKQLAEQQRSAEAFRDATGSTGGVNNTVLNATASARGYTHFSVAELLREEHRLALSQATLDDQLMLLAVQRVVARHDAEEVSRTRETLAYFFADGAPVAQRPPSPSPAGKEAMEPTAQPPAPPQSFVDPLAAKIEADRKRAETQAYLLAVEGVLTSNNQHLQDLVIQQGLLLNGVLRKSDAAGLSDYQKTILGEVNDRIAAGRLGPNAALIVQQSRERLPPLLEVARDALAIVLERAAAAAAAAAIAGGSAFVSPGQVVTAPGGTSVVPAELIVNPDGSITPKRPGGLLPPDSGGTGKLNVPRPGPPGAFPDELFRRNPPDP